MVPKKARTIAGAWPLKLKTKGPSPHSAATPARRPDPYGPGVMRLQVSVAAATSPASRCALVGFVVGPLVDPRLHFRVRRLAAPEGAPGGGVWLLRWHVHSPRGRSTDYIWGRYKSIGLFVIYYKTEAVLCV